MDDARRRAWAALDLGPVWVARTAVGAAATCGDAEVAGAPHADDVDAPAAPDLQSLRLLVESCRDCALCESRTRTVFGVGPDSAGWMVVGEAPGAEEDARGEPFVGQAGKLLDDMLGSIGLSRDRDVFIANVLKCRPPRNRDPRPEEVERCAPKLRRQIELVAPRVIVVVGRFAAHALLGTDASIASLRGKVHAYRVGERDVPVVVSYHPAYLLRNLPDKAKAWADLCLARDAAAAVGG